MIISYCYRLADREVNHAFSFKHTYGLLTRACTHVHSLEFKS